jgi:choice-of-anchor A domain-containing protein
LGGGRIQLILWAFTDATSITIGPSLSWEGTVLAGDAAITITGSVPIHGTVIARTITGSATGYNDLPADDIQLP